MSTTTELAQPDSLEDQALAEAAAWLARLHRPRRTAQDEAGFRRWLAEKPAHARAWALASEMWENAQRLPLNLRPSVTRESRWWQPLVWQAVAASVAMLVVAVAIVQFRDPVIATAIGEQRVVTLEDGTRLSLNTATKLRVQFTPQARRVQLLAGEALFEVAKRPTWPFVVEVDHRTVTALGTAFVIRRDPKRVAVTLVEGRIAIDEVNRDAQPKIPPPSATLEAGERMTFAADSKPQRDRPALDSVVAWQRGQAIFDNVRLADAVAEMNRYNGVVPLAIADAAAADLPVSGIFRLGDSVSFAKAVAFNYGLKLSEESTHLVLASENSSTAH